MISNQLFSSTDAKRGAWVAGREASVALPLNARARIFSEAMALLEDGRWQHAFMHFAELADAGHSPAARIALLMVRSGSRLFGGSYRASAGQLASWQRAVD